MATNPFSTSTHPLVISKTVLKIDIFDQVFMKNCYGPSIIGILRTDSIIVIVLEMITKIVAQFEIHFWIHASKCNVLH